MKIDLLEEIYNELNADSYFRDLVSQSDARYILYKTKDQKENFPPTSFTNEQLELLAFQYLDLGCRITENGKGEIGVFALEKAASILYSVHNSSAPESIYGKFYGLIASMAYYSSFHYSRSFVTAKELEQETLISRLITLFMKRDFSELLSQINKVIVNREYTDESIANISDYSLGFTRIYEIVIAKALYRVVKYLQSGDLQLLNKSRSDLLGLQKISEITREPAIRWVVKLMSIMFDGIEVASLWKSIDPLFNTSSNRIDKYIRGLVFSNPPVTELFKTQRESLSKVLNTNDSGAVISLPTSSGKTRIAEIAILDCLEKDSSAKVLYIAPFRSLSFEVENSLATALKNAGISISGLYGSGFVVESDVSELIESDVIVATPEKVKSILRYNKNLVSQVRLIIVDEGHLLGDDDRLTRNEIFIEELRFTIERNGGKFLVLSAVLPNAEDIARWLTKSETNLSTSKWKTSNERLGTLEFTKNNVNVVWRKSNGEQYSINPDFVKNCTTKNEAIVKAAYKFRENGVTLIFVGLKTSVFTIAKEYEINLGENPPKHEWLATTIWERYVLAVKENYGEENNWLKYAELGILCHNGDLHADVRIPLEQLMYKDKPLVIIATSTLGQGVNLGVSTVVFQGIYQAGKQLSKRDFWNIAGRAGRAFVDNEAKIIVAFDKEVDAKNDEGKIQDTEKKILEYFDKTKIEKAASGVFAQLKFILKTAENTGIEFELLLSYLSENNFAKFGAKSTEIEEKLDLIDDSLLTLHMFHLGGEDEISYDWIDTFFSQSLGYLQAIASESISSREYLDFIKARVKGIWSGIGAEKIKCENHISSGIPLRSNKYLDTKIEEIIRIVQNNMLVDQGIESKIKTSKEIIACINDVPEFKQDDLSLLNREDFNKILETWMIGNRVTHFKGCSDIVSKLFMFKIPWIFNGIANNIDARGLENESNFVREIALSIDSGLPDIKSNMLYQAGIKSRRNAYELSKIFDDSGIEKNVSGYKNALKQKGLSYKLQVSGDCGKWLDLVCLAENTEKIWIKNITDFQLGNLNEKCEKLSIISVNSDHYLVSPDLKIIENARNYGIDFSSVSDVPGVHYVYAVEDELWKLQVENPFVAIE